jgi:hypothetical protein
MDNIDGVSLFSVSGPYAGLGASVLPVSVCASVLPVFAGVSVLPVSACVLVLPVSVCVSLLPVGVAPVATWLLFCSVFAFTVEVCTAGVAVDTGCSLFPFVVPETSRTASFLT